MNRIANFIRYRMTLNYCHGFKKIKILKKYYMVHKTTSARHREVYNDFVLNPRLVKHFFKIAICNISFYNFHKRQDN